MFVDVSDLDAKVQDVLEVDGCERCLPQHGGKCLSLGAGWVVVRPAVHGARLDCDDHRGGCIEHVVHRLPRCDVLSPLRSSGSGMRM